MMIAAFTFVGDVFLCYERAMESYFKARRKDAARRFVERDAAEIAADHSGEVVDYGNGEWVVNSRSGEEIARWEIL